MNSSRSHNSSRSRTPRPTAWMTHRAPAWSHRGWARSESKDKAFTQNGRTRLVSSVHRTSSSSISPESRPQTKRKSDMLANPLMDVRKRTMRRAKMGPIPGNASNAALSARLSSMPTADSQTSATFTRGRHASLKAACLLSNRQRSQPTGGNSSAQHSKSDTVGDGSCSRLCCQSCKSFQ